MATSTRTRAREWLIMGVCLGLVACSSGKGPDTEMPNPHASPSPTSPRPANCIPGLDADAPRTIQTATFALG